MLRRVALHPSRRNKFQPFSFDHSGVKHSLSLRDAPRRVPFASPACQHENRRQKIIVVIFKQDAKGVVAHGEGLERERPFLTKSCRL